MDIFIYLFLVSNFMNEIYFVSLYFNYSSVLPICFHIFEIHEAH